MQVRRMGCSPREKKHCSPLTVPLRCSFLVSSICILTVLNSIGIRDLASPPLDMRLNGAPAFLPLVWELTDMRPVAVRRRARSGLA